MMDRSQWRDAWLEQAILKAMSGAKKRSARGHVSKKRVRKAKHAPRSGFDTKKARSMYGRDVHCPSGMTLTELSAMKPSKIINIPLTVSDEGPTLDMQSAGKTQSAIQEVAATIDREMKSGGMCLTTEGRVMATPLCKEMVKVQFERDNMNLSKKKKAQFQASIDTFNAKKKK